MRRSGRITYISVRSFRHSQNEQERTTYARLLSIGIVAVAMLILYLTGVTGGYDTTLLAYLYGTVILSRMFFKDHLFDTLVLAQELALDTMSEGFIVVNNAERIIYHNEKIEQLYPQVKEMQENDLIDQLDEYILQNKKLEIGNNVYSVTSHLLQKDRSYLGKMYIILDITDSYHYTQNIMEQTRIMKKLKERAENANQEKTALISGMIGQIREPMDAILSQVDQLSKETGENEKKNNLQELKNSAGELLKAVDSLARMQQ